MPEIAVDKINEIAVLKTSRVGRITTACCGLCLLTAVLCWAVVWFAAERWWPATVILFGPKWLLAVGTALVALIALVRRQFRSLSLAGVALVICVFPIMGFSLPHRTATADAPGSFHLRLLCSSVYGIYPSGPNWAAYDAYIKTGPADVVALQEWGGGPTGRVYQFDELNGHVCCDDELRLWSRYPIKYLGPAFPSPGWAKGRAVAYELATPAGPVVLINLHLASPHDAFRAVVRRHDDAATMVQFNSDQRLAQATAVAKAAREYGSRVIVVGDFNLPGEGRVFQQDFDFLRDAFKQGNWGFGWTYFARGVAARLDHVLTGSAWTCRSLSLEPCEWSPHRRLIANLELTEPR